MALALAGCIPGVEPPPRPGPPPGQEPPYEDDRPGRGVVDVPAPRPARPAWETRPVSADARDVAETTVIVRRGEGLRAVADRSGAGVD